MATLTSKGLELLAESQANNTVFNVNSFAYYHQDSLDITQEVPESIVLDASYLVYESQINKKSYINNHAVVFTSILEPNVGDFLYNIIALKIDDDIVAVSYTPLSKKIATIAQTLGNNLINNFALEYQNIQDLTAINVEAETWQLDFSSYLNAIDDRQIKSNTNIYSRNYFIEDSFLVRKESSVFIVGKGKGVVGGIEQTQLEDEVLIIDSFPKYVYVDSYLEGSILSKEAKHNIVLSDDILIDFIDGVNTHHYLVKIAKIQDENTIIDFRNETLNHLHNTSQLIDFEEQMTRKADSSHNHSINDIDELNGVLNDKASRVHTHEIENINNLEEVLNKKAPITHNHELSHTIGLMEALRVKVTLSEERFGSWHRPNVVDNDDLYYLHKDVPQNAVFCRLDSPSRTGAKRAVYREIVEGA